MVEMSNIQFGQEQYSENAHDFDSTIIPISHIVGSGLLETTNSPFSFAVGIRPNLMPVLANFERQGSWLVGGIAGSGKTTFIHSLIFSMVYRTCPKELKFAIASLKSEENEVYAQLPHLLYPIITTPKQAMDLLEWAVKEMMRRYTLFSKAQVRTIKAYNSLPSIEDTSILPRIVIVIDELKQVMDINAKEAEEAICRIGWMGKSAGIHLVLSTQYADPAVITGPIKANIQSRIAFRTASERESSVVLDVSGAEKLEKPGTLLYHHRGSSEPTKLLGYHMSSAELSDALSCLSRFYNADHIEERKMMIEREISLEYPAENELFRSAVNLVLKEGTATVSLLQRKLKLNYSMAAMIMDQMEERGIVGPFLGSKPRAVLISEAVWKRMHDKMINGGGEIC